MSRTLLIVIVALVGLDAATANAVAPSPPARTPVPAAAVVEATEKLIRTDLLPKQYADRTPAGRKALAEALRSLASETKDDPPGRYVLLREWLAAAAAVGDAESTTSAADQLAAEYDVPPAATKLDAVQRCLPTTNAAGAKSLARSCFALAAAASEREEYADAAGALAVAEQAARKAGDGALVADARRQAEDVKRLQAIAVQLVEARKTWDADPADSAANLAIGRAYCLARGDWDRGLEYLTRGADAALKEAALRDLSAGDDPAKLADAADDWWALADKYAGLEKQRLRERAALLYHRASPQLVGLRKALAAKRVVEVPTFTPPAPKRDATVAGGPAIIDPPAPQPAPPPAPPEPPPGPRQPLGKRRVKAVVHAAADDSFALYVNGQKVCEADRSGAATGNTTIGVGDVITVRTHNKDYEWGFGCAIRLENGGVIISHSATWRSYTPRDEAAWHVPAGITNEAPVALAHDKYFRAPLAKLVQADSEPIWSAPSPGMPAGAGRHGHAYLCLRVAEEMITDFKPTDPALVTRAAPRTQKRVPATLVAFADEDFSIYVNGHRVGQGQINPHNQGTAALVVPLTVAVGDVVTVKAHNIAYEKAFGCVIKLDDGRVVISHPDTWVAYNPRNPLRWYEPSEILDAAAPSKGEDRYIKPPLDAAVNADRVALWGLQKHGQVAYLATKITAASFQQPTPNRPNDR